MSTPCKKSHTQKGFVVLFAVLVSSIVLAIALGIADVALKEIVFSSQANYSHVAFFAADTGLECGLYHNRTTPSPFLETTGSPTSSPVTMLCAGQSVTSATPTVTGSGVAKYIFQLSLPDTSIPITGSVRPECAIITVTKNIVDATSNPGTLGTDIESRGYNTGCSNVSNKSDGHIVERVLDATYFEVGSTGASGTSGT